jgi:hypothetical protein
MNQGRRFMKISRWLISCAILALSVPVIARAQGSAGSDASETAKKEAPPVPIKLQVVLSDYDGTKKVSSLPYTIPLVVSGTRPGGPYSSIRVGVKVPVTTAAKTGDSAVQYIDVGTSIDARAARTDDGRFWVDLTVDRSSFYIAAPGDGKIMGKEWSDGEAPPGRQPVLRQYRGSIGLFVHEGQATEASVATDPLTGHLLKVEVTLTEVK